MSSKSELLRLFFKHIFDARTIDVHWILILLRMPGNEDVFAFLQQSGCCDLFQDVPSGLRQPQ